MQRILSILLIGVLLIGALTGCAKREAAAEPAMQLDMVQLVETAQGAPDADKPTVRAQVQAPEMFLYTANENGLVITADAPIVIPDVADVSILRVQRGAFTQEQVTALWDALVGDMPLCAHSYEMTRSEIEAQFKRIDKQLVDTSEKQYHADWNDADWEAYLSELRKERAYLENLYKTAPERIEPVRATSEIKRIDATKSCYGEDMRWDGVGAATPDGAENAGGFMVENPILPGRTAQMYFSAFGDGSITYSSYASPNTVVVLENDAIPQQARPYLSQTPAGARAAVEALLKKVNLPFVVSSLSLRREVSMDAEGEEEAAGTRYVYAISCARDSNGTPCTSITGSTVHLDAHLMGDDSASWDYETMLFHVNDHGIVSMTWRAPLFVSGVTVEKCTLLPFSQIQNVFEKMMPVTYSNRADAYTQYVCNITEVRFELLRTVEKNNPGSGLLVPVWNFYGVRYGLTNGEVYNKTSNVIALSVNAVDGSIISLDKGY